jgi:hypothetical protein
MKITVINTTLKKNNFTIATFANQAQANEVAAKLEPMLQKTKAKDLPIIISVIERNGGKC